MKHNDGIDRETMIVDHKLWFITVFWNILDIFRTHEMLSNQTWNEAEGAFWPIGCLFVTKCDPALFADMQIIQWLKPICTFWDSCSNKCIKHISCLNYPKSLYQYNFRYFCIKIVQMNAPWPEPPASGRKKTPC